MSARKQQASACTVYRPDAAGNMVAVATAPATAKPRATVRGGQSYGIWHDLVQAWQFGPATLEACAAELASQRTEGDIMFWRGEFYPAPLNAAERAAVRAAYAEAAE
ncbi:MAG: hypothetical protein NUV34_10025 [Sulfuricaulis sp.]|nr:hypothetical protein [Sulfuricaulis sp.]